MRKHVIVIAALALVAGACSSSSSGDSTTTTTAPPVVSTTSTVPPSTMVITPDPITSTIEIWAPGVLLGPIGDAADAFEIETGIAVEVSAVELDVMLERVLEDPMDGPDVFVGPHMWLTTLVEAGVAEPITVDSTVVGGAAAGVRLRNSTYAAPFGLDTIVQFRDAGALASAPGTVEAFADGCVVGGNTLPCLALASNSVEGHWPFITAVGGYLFGPDEFAGWDKDDVGVDTAEALAGGLVLEQVMDGAGILGGDGFSTARQRFAAGATPVFWGGLSDLVALEEAGIEFVVDELPTIGDQPAAGPVDTTALWVNAFSTDKEAAVRLVERYLAVPENARTLANALGLAPVDIDYDGDPNLVPFTRSGVIGLPRPPIEATTLAWDELASTFDAIRSGQASSVALEGAASQIRAGA